jgi:hypothetical protein
VAYFKRILSESTLRLKTLVDKVKKVTTQTCLQEEENIASKFQSLVGHNTKSKSKEMKNEAKFVSHLLTTVK